MILNMFLRKKLPFRLSNLMINKLKGKNNSITFLSFRSTRMNKSDISMLNQKIKDFKILKQKKRKPYIFFKKTYLVCINKNHQLKRK